MISHHERFQTILAGLDQGDSGEVKEKKCCGVDACPYVSDGNGILFYRCVQAY
jgi:hypothetical protein